MAEQTGDKDFLKDLMSGRTDAANRTDRHNNMIRVFICSTFTDMSVERKALLEKVYPQVLAFCRSLGLVFEVVDLCWGVRGVSSHQSSEIFLHEIENCRRVSAGPNFIALLGNKYGHRSLPHQIPEKIFESFLSRINKNPEGLKLLSQWYLQDTNQVPPTYVLQPITTKFPHYSDITPENGPIREKEIASWRLTENQLLSLLRSVATDAEKSGDITSQQKQLFYSSVLERELDAGLFSADSDQNALLFVRETHRHRVRDKRFSRFRDMAADGLMDADTQGQLTELKKRLYARNSLNLHCVELSKGVVDPKRREHAQYLDSVCEECVSQMKENITAAMEERERRRGERWGEVADEKEKEKEDNSDWLVEEVVRHVTMSTDLCRGLFGREGILGKLCLSMWESTSVYHPPVVVHGIAGIGKTALLCKLAQEMSNVLGNGAVLVIRLLGASHSRPDIHSVLRSISAQVCLACGLATPPPMTANNHQELRRFFRNVLEEVSQQCKGKTLLIILASVDYLSVCHSAHTLRWLPPNIPPNVHLVVSMDTDSRAFSHMRLQMDGLGPVYHLERLTVDEGKQIMESYLNTSQRTLTPDQRDIVLKRFEHTGSPLHLKLMLGQATKWPSYITPGEVMSHLGADTREMMSQILFKMEDRHGKELVSAALGYLTLAREGLLEGELRDLLSLDDDVISEVYRVSPPPCPSLLRLPPLHWAQLRLDMGGLLEEKWTNGVAYISFNNRRVCELVSSRYMTSERRGRSLKILSEYFLGRWAGKLKPVSLPGLTLLLSDRKVPPMPLWLAPGLANVRKLQELPSHLLNAGMWDELKTEVIGNAEWLYCQSRLLGVSSVVSELVRCSRHMDCSETALIGHTLGLIKPSMDFLDGHMDMSLFYTELLARLSSLAKPCPAVIGRLCSQCESFLLTCEEPALIPKCSFLQQPGGALKHTLTTGLQGGVVCMDVSSELLVAGSGDGVVSVWSLDDHQLIHSLIGHTGAVLSVKVIDRCRCVSVSCDGSVRQWSLITGQQLLCYHDAVPIGSSPSPSHLHLSHQLMFVYTSTQVKVWSVAGDDLLYSSTSHSDSDGDDAFKVLGILQDSVVSLSASGLLRMSHPVNSTQTVETQLNNFTMVHSVTLPKRGKVFLVSKEGFLHQVSMSGKHTEVEFPLIPSLLSVSEDEKILIAGSDRTLSLFTIDLDSVNRFLDLTHGDRVLSVCVSADCRLLVTGAADQLIRIWSVTTGSLLDSLCGSDAPVTSLVLHNDVILLSASAAVCGVHVWSLKYDARHKPTARIPTGCVHMALTRDTDRVYYAQRQGQREVTVWNNNTGCVSERFETSAAVSCIQLVQTKRLLLCGLQSGTVLIYPLSLPQETLCIPPPPSLSSVLALSVSNQEKHMAVAYEDSVALFEITSRDSFPTVDGPVKVLCLSLLHGPLSALALLPDKRLIYGTLCGAVKLHDFSRQDASSDLECHSSAISCVTAGNWGKHALIGSSDAVQRLWNLDPPTLEHTMEHKGFFFEGVLCAAFSESDQFVFTGSQDKTVKVWDVSTGNLLYVQYLYSPVVRMVTNRNGFVALSQHGDIIREVFCCPEQMASDYNPLKNYRSQYTVTSYKGKNQEVTSSSVDQLKDFNPAQINMSVLSMLTAAKSSNTCVLL